MVFHILWFWSQVAHCFLIVSLITAVLHMFSKIMIWKNHSNIKSIFFIIADVSKVFYILIFVAPCVKYMCFVMFSKASFKIHFEKLKCFEMSGNSVTPQVVIQCTEICVLYILCCLVYIIIMVNEWLCVCWPNESIVSLLAW